MKRVTLLILVGLLGLGILVGALLGSKPTLAAPMNAPLCRGAWQPANSPNVGTTNNRLLTIAAISPTDVWAGGNTGVNHLMQHWDGNAWTIVPLPSVGNGTIRGLTALATNDVWAVGDYFNTNFDQTQALILHWDGTAWTQAPNSSFGFTSLYGVAAVGPNDIWAVGSVFGTPVTLHYDGTAWTPFDAAAPNAYNRLVAVSVIATNDVWAVGYTGATLTATTPLIQHWDGTAWTSTKSPIDGTLTSVAAVAANDVWAVGKNVSNQALMIHYNGISWTQKSPGFTYGDSSVLNSVVALAPDNVWAVGTAMQGGQPIAFSASWNGLGWAGRGLLMDIQTNPGQHTYGNSLASIAADQFVAVGAQEVAGVVQTFISNYACPPTPTATITPGGQTFYDVPTSQTFYPFIEALAAANVVSGYPCGGLNELCDPQNRPFFRPYNNVTRGQLAKIVVLAEGWPINTAGGPHFTDVPETHPFYGVIETAFNQGVVSGYGDSTFQPYNNVTRGQLAKIVVLAEGWAINTTGGPHFTDVPPTHTFYGVIETAYNRGIISGYGDGTFRPYANVTRGQLSKIIYLAINQ